MEVGRIIEPEEAVAEELEVVVAVEGVAVTEVVLMAVVVAAAVVEVGVELACAGRRGSVEEEERGARVRVEVVVEVELGAEAKERGGEVVKEEEGKVDDKEG